MEKSAEAIIPPHDPDCYLCPGAARANGQINPLYDGVFAFDNDFAALRLGAARGEIDDGLLVARTEAGLCRVICFSPRHDLTLSRMAIPDIARVVDRWRDEFATLGALDAVNYVQIFENKGAAMGASNPHPHCQIWASESLPNEAEKESRSQRDYMARRGSCLLCDYLARERTLANASFARTTASSLWFRFGRHGRSKQWCSPSATLVRWTNFAPKITSCWPRC